MLEELWDQPCLIRQLLNTFIWETQRDLDNLMTAFRSLDGARAAKIAHGMKGSAGTIGAEPLRALAERIEALSREGCLQHALDCTPAIHGEFARFCSYVTELSILE